MCGYPRSRGACTSKAPRSSSGVCAPCQQPLHHIVRSYLRRIIVTISYRPGTTKVLLPSVKVL